MEPLDVVQGDETVHEARSDSEESTADQGTTQNEAAIALDDIVLTDDTVEGDEQRTSQEEDMKGSDAGYLATERKETSSRAGRDEGDAEMGDTGGEAQVGSTPVMTEEADVEQREARSDEEDEGIGLDGEELDDNEKEEEELNRADGTAAMEEG